MNTRSLLTTLLLALLAIGPGVAQVQDPIADAAYRGSGNALLTMPDRTITEAEFYRFQKTVNRNPFAARGWQTWVQNNENGKLQVLRQELRNMLMVEWLSQVPEASTLSKGELDEKGARMYAASVARDFWSDNVVEKEVVVHDEDIAYYFRKNWKLLATPETATILRVRLKVEEPVGPATRLAARNRLKELRDRAQLEGGLDVLIEEDRALSPDSGGRAITLRRDSVGYDPQIIDSAFTLGVSRVSDVLEVGEELYLVEVVGRTVPGIPTLEEVRPVVERRLRARFLPQQSDYRILKLSKNIFPVNRGIMYSYLQDEIPILRVRNFEITRGEFTELFPEIIGDPANPNKAAISGLVAIMVQSEIILQDLERLGMINNAEYLQALEWARSYLLSNRVRMKRAGEALVAEEDVDRVLRERSAMITPSERRDLWRLAIEPRQRGDLTPEDLRTAQVLNRAHLASIAAQASQQIMERSAIAGEQIFSVPGPVFEKLPRPLDSRYRVRFEFQGTYTPQSAREQLGVNTENVTRGGFSDAVPLPNGGAVAYYVSGILPPVELNPEALRAAARWFAGWQYGEKPATDRINAMEDDGSLRYAFPVSLELR